MKTKSKNKPSPEDELTRLRQRIAELEAVETEHKQTVEALQQSEERFRAIAETLSFLSLSAPYLHQLFHPSYQVLLSLDLPISVLVIAPALSVIFPI